MKGADLGERSVPWGAPSAWGGTRTHLLPLGKRLIRRGLGRLGLSYARASGGDAREIILGVGGNPH